MEFFKKRREIFFISAAILFIVITTILIRSSRENQPNDKIEIIDADINADGQLLFIDISGAILSPGLYKMPAGSRTGDVITKAGGFLPDADKSWISHFLNQARILKDQEKIYIPFEEEEKDVGDVRLININAASSEELENLDGIGPSTAEKIINGRPYNSVDELTGRKIISASLFEKIRTEIEIR